MSGDGRRERVEFDSFVLQTSVKDLRERENDTRGEGGFRIADFALRLFKLGLVSPRLRIFDLQKVIIPPTAEGVKKSVRARLLISIRKFAGWEGRFTPAQDSFRFILELPIHC